MFHPAILFLFGGSIQKRVSVREGHHSEHDGLIHIKAFTAPELVDNEHDETPVDLLLYG